MRSLFCALILVVTVAAAPPKAKPQHRLPSTAAPLLYDLTIKPDAAKLTFDGEAEIIFEAKAPLPSVTLNAAELKFSRAAVDGMNAKQISLDDAAQTVTLSFSTPLKPGEHRLSFAWTGKIATTAAGLFALDYKKVDGGDARMLATQFEAPDARRFAPMWDEPGFKARFRLHALTPKGQSAFSNMPIEASEDVSGGTLVHFAETPKMSSYLLFLGMGEIDRKTRMVEGVEVGIITRKGVADQGDYALDAAAKIIPYYNDYFGTPYPLPKLDMIAAPGSSQFFGAMENWGAILYFESRVLIDPKLVTENQRQDVYTTVAHEIAHQWFGNLVTMAWWDDLWLNEGFASWMESKATGDLNPEWRIKSQTVAGGRQAAMNLDARQTTHPIVQKIETVDQIAQAFDSITYQKGEAVIAMLEANLGEAPFRAGVRTYMQKHAYSNTVTEQLWDELGASSGKPVSEIMRGFTKQGGVPMIRVGLPTCKNGETHLTLTQDRFGLDAPSRAPLKWDVPVPLGLAGGGADPDKLVIVSGTKPVPTTLSGCGKPVVNYGQTGYFRTLYDPLHFDILRTGFAALSVDDQLGLLADSLAMANGDYAPVSQHLGLISTVPSDASPMVWTLVSSHLGGLADRLKANPAQAAFHRKAARLLAPVFERVGWEQKAGEAPAVAQLRAQLLPVLAEFGDAKLIAEAKRYVEQDMSNPGSVPSEIIEIARSAYMRSVDAAGWETMHQRARDEKSPVAQRRFYRSLGTAKDAKLAQRALDLALRDEAPVQTRSTIIAAVANEHPALAFDWAAKNKKAVNDLLEASSQSEFIVGLASGGNDLKLAERVMAYAKSNLPAASRAPADQAAALIRYRAQRKIKQSPGLIAWSSQ